MGRGLISSCTFNELDCLSDLSCEGGRGGVLLVYLKLSMNYYFDFLSG